MNKHTWKTRNLISIFMMLAFTLMTASGVILYIVPAGRIAAWTGWQLLWLSKTQWMNIHTISSLFFIITAIIHLVLNWNQLLSYISRKAESLLIRRELSVAVIIMIFVVTGTLAEIQPFQSIIKLGSDIKNSWIKTSDYEPPIGHAELLSFSSFTRRMGIDPDTAASALAGKEIKVTDRKATIEQIARDNRTTPLEIYMVIKRFASDDRGKISGPRRES